jgi:uncharacterized cupredoxin-like copper-binding protein
MKKLLIASALSFGLVSTAALAQEETEAIGKPGDPSHASRIVEITAVDNRFKPDRINVKQGETIKFLITNLGKKKHEMMIGTAEEIDKHGKMLKKHSDHAHPDQPNMVSIEPGRTGELVWHFTDAGVVDFACPLPGHFKGMNFPGMKGTITVGAK